VRQDRSRDDISRKKAKPFSRHLKGLFFFLIALIGISQISPLVLLTGLIGQEDRLLTARLDGALADLRRLWSSSPAGAPDSLDLLALVRTHHLAHLWLSVADRDSRDGRAWDTVIVLPAVAASGDAGGPTRSLEIAEMWGRQSIRARATIAAPLAAGLRRQLRSELWLRGAVLLAFGLFAWLFYQSVLRPFHDMRRRATALVETGLLPPAPGQADRDPEYVMATFDILVQQLLKEAKRLETRALYSERQARSLEQFNDYILSSLTTGVIILDCQGRILRFNRTAEQILHIPAAAAQGQHFAQSGLSPGLVSILEAGLAEGRVFSRHELRIDRNAADPIFLGINTSCIRTDEGEVVGLSLLLTDLTLIKRLQDEVAENQRLADLGELAAGLAHQLRNSIAAIFGYGRLLRSAAPADENSRRWIEEILGETEETSQMLTRFLDFARPLQGERHRVDLYDVIAEAIDTAQPTLERQHVRVRAAQKPDAPAYILGDALLLKQVFVNLIQNAAEASPADEEIRIHVDRAGADEKTCRWQVAVIDNGPGVPLEDRAHIFQPFFTTKEAGTGLGLPLAKKIVGFHGGTMTLDSTGSEGSTFLVTLPAAASHQAEPAWQPALTAALTGEQGLKPLVRRPGRRAPCPGIDKLPASGYRRLGKPSAGQSCTAP